MKNSLQTDRSLFPAIFPRSGANGSVLGTVMPQWKVAEAGAPSPHSSRPRHTAADCLSRACRRSAGESSAVSRITIYAEEFALLSPGGDNGTVAVLNGLSRLHHGDAVSVDPSEVADTLATDDAFVTVTYLHHGRTAASASAAGQMLGWLGRNVSGVAVGDGPGDSLELLLDPPSEGAERESWLASRIDTAHELYVAETLRAAGAVARLDVYPLATLRAIGEWRAPAGVGHGAAAPRWPLQCPESDTTSGMFSKLAFANQLLTRLSCWLVRLCRCRR
jgi:hypothetical protein